MSGTGLAVEVLPMGEHAVLVELADLDAVLTLEDAVRPLAGSGASVWGRVVDVVPAARTLLLTLDGTTAGDVDALGRAVREVAGGVHPGGGRTAVPEEVVVPVRYDGPDLAEVARLTGLSTAEVVAAHTGTPWRVAFGGFAPGFAYLVGGDPRLSVPRRDAPRPSVPAGSVGLAGGFSGVYPRASPGGWRLLGSTDLVLWDEHRDPPALLRPGVVVHFVADGDGR